MILLVYRAVGHERRADAEAQTARHREARRVLEAPPISIIIVIVIVFIITTKTITITILLLLLLLLYYYCY